MKIERIATVDVYSDMDTTKQTGKGKAPCISVDEVKALQDIRRIVVIRFHTGGFNAVEKANLNVTLTHVHSALTKLENAL